MAPGRFGKLQVCAAAVPSALPQLCGNVLVRATVLRGGGEGGSGPLLFFWVWCVTLRIDVGNLEGVDPRFPSVSFADHVQEFKLILQLSLISTFMFSPSPSQCPPLPPLLRLGHFFSRSYVLLSLPHAHSSHLKLFYDILRTRTHQSGSWQLRARTSMATIVCTLINGPRETDLISRRSTFLILQSRQKQPLPRSLKAV